MGRDIAAPHNFPVHLAARVRESDPPETSTVLLAQLCMDAMLRAASSGRKKSPKMTKWNKKMTKQKVPTQVSHRNSKDGQFVTERYAERHPDTTERERIKHPK